MGTTVLDAIENAKQNIQTARNIKNMRLLPIAEQQLGNAILLLEKGYSAYTSMDDVIARHGSIDEAPDKST